MDSTLYLSLDERNKEAFKQAFVSVFPEYDFDNLRFIRPLTFYYGIEKSLFSVDGTLFILEYEDSYGGKDYFNWSKTDFESSLS